MKHKRTSDSFWQAWTDGACYPNPGPGGSVAVIEFSVDRKVKETNIVACSPGQNYKGSDKNWRGTTNNRAELYAILLAVKYFASNDDQNRGYALYSDSKWCVKTLAFDIWQDPTGWDSGKNKDIRNLIVSTASPIKKRFSIHWIPRNSHPNHALADKLSKEQREIASTYFYKHNKKPKGVK